MTKFLGADGVTHLYSKIKSWVTSNFLSKSGGTITGALEVTGALTVDEVTELNDDVSIDGELNCSGTVTASTFKGSLNGNATSATKATSATSSSYITSYGTHTETASGTTGNAPTTGMATTTAGLFMSETYNDSNTPAMYGNIINVIGKSYIGTGQLLLEWPGNSNDTGRLYYRSHRDQSGSGWTSWSTVAYTSDIPSEASDINYGSSTVLKYKNGNTEEITETNTLEEIIDYFVDALNQLAS